MTGNVTSIVCAGCGFVVSPDEPYPFRCPNVRPGDDVDHVARARAEPVEHRARQLEHDVIVRRATWMERLFPRVNGEETQIVPVIVGGTLRTFEFWKRLLDAGVFTNPVIAPAVPATSGRIRSRIACR